MSVKNGMPHLPQTVQSVLAQSLQEWEWIIIDDGSTDDTWAELKKINDPRVRAFSQSNTGVAAAKNRAIALSTAPYLAIIDADDLWHPHKLARQVAFMQKHPQHVLVACFADIIDEEGHYLYTEKKPVSDAENRRFNDIKNTWTHSACMFTRKAFDQVGGYYEPVKQYIVDYMLMYQLSLIGKVHQLPEALVQYRIVSTSLSTKADGKTFRSLMHRAIRAGSMTAAELQEMEALKERERRTPAFKKAMYHLYLGRTYLFHNYQPRKSRQHLAEAMRLYPSLRIAGIYWLMARFFPAGLIRWVYGQLSPLSGYTYVKT